MRTLGEALRDPHFDTRGIRHKHSGGNNVAGEFTVPLAAFRLADGGPRIDTPPPTLGQHNEE